MSWPGFPCGSAGKESAHNAGDQGLIPGLESSSGEGNGNPLQGRLLGQAQEVIIRDSERWFWALWAQLYPAQVSESDPDVCNTMTEFSVSDYVLPTSYQPPLDKVVDSIPQTQTVEFLQMA